LRVVGDRAYDAGSTMLESTSMIRSMLFAALSLSLVATACAKKEGDKADPAATGDTAATKPAEPAAEPATVGAWKKLPNINGLKADVPTGVTENGVGGAAGFHNDAGLMWTVRELEGEEAAKDFDTAKGETEQILFKKWIKSEATADGWVLLWEGSKMDAEGNESGTQYSFEVRRKIGDKTYTCYGTTPTAEELETAAKSCASLKAS
jgi:hypothetical protein